VKVGLLNVRFLLRIDHDINQIFFMNWTIAFYRQLILNVLLNLQKKKI